MSRLIQFRAWDSAMNKYHYWNNKSNSYDGIFWSMVKRSEFKHGVEQYTELKDKNGVEVYENCEIDNKFIVLFVNGSYVLHDISNEVIFNLYKHYEVSNGQIEVTKERHEMA